MLISPQSSQDSVTSRRNSLSCQSDVADPKKSRTSHSPRVSLLIDRIESKEMENLAKKAIFGNDFKNADTPRSTIKISPTSSLLRTTRAREIDKKDLVSSWKEVENSNSNSK